MKQDKYMLVNPPYKHVPQLLERCWPTNTKKAECTALAKVFSSVFIIQFKINHNFAN